MKTVEKKIIISDQKSGNVNGSLLEVSEENIKIVGFEYNCFLNHDTIVFKVSKTKKNLDGKKLSVWKNKTYK